MRAFTAREKTLIALAAVALVLLAYAFGLLRPARRTLGELRRQEADLKDRLGQAERMYREAGAAQQQIADLKAKSQAIMFPSSDVQSGMVTEIEKLSKELGVPVASIRPGETESANGSMRHPAVFKIEADIGKIAQFLYELEQPSRRLWVEGVEIASARETGTTLSATIYVAAYSPSRGSEAKNAQA